MRETGKFEMMAHREVCSLPFRKLCSFRMIAVRDGRQGEVRDPGMRRNQLILWISEIRDLSM